MRSVLSKISGKPNAKDFMRIEFCQLSYSERQLPSRSNEYSKLRGVFFQVPLFSEAPKDCIDHSVAAASNNLLFRSWRAQVAAHRSQKQFQCRPSRVPNSPQPKNIDLCIFGRVPTDPSVRIGALPCSNTRQIEMVAFVSEQQDFRSDAKPLWSPNADLRTKTPAPLLACHRSWLRPGTGADAIGPN